MKITPKRKVAILALAFGVILFAVSIAHAQYAILIAGQSNEEDVSTSNISTGTRQGIGTGLWGTVTAISMKFQGVVSGSGDLPMYFEIFECTDAAYTSCVEVGETVSDTNTWGTGTTQQVYTAQLNTSYTIDRDLWYYIQANTGAPITVTGTFYYVGTDDPDYFRGTGQSLIAGGTGLSAIYYDVIGEYTAEGISVGAATSSSMFSDQTATSTLQDLADQCSQTSNAFAEAICISFSFLFMPGQTTINRWAALSDEYQTKFPFSWVYESADLFESLTYTASSSPVYTMSLHDLNIGSTSPMGNILPNFTAFSSTTVMQYIPSNVWAAFQALIAASLWLLLGFDIYHTIRRRHSHV